MKIISLQETHLIVNEILIFSSIVILTLSVIAIVLVVAILSVLVILIAIDLLHPILHELPFSNSPKIEFSLSVEKLWILGTTLDYWCWVESNESVTLGDRMTHIGVLQFV